MLWREEVQALRDAEFPAIELRHLYVGNRAGESGALAPIVQAVVDCGAGSAGYADQSRRHRRLTFSAPVMNMDFANSVIAEWQSPNFRELYGKLFLVLAFGFFLANIYRRTKPDLTEIALPVSLLFAGFVSLRHIPLATFVLVPFVAVALRDGPVQRFYGRVTGGGKQLGNIEYVLNWVLLVVVGLTFYLLNPTQQAKAQARLNEAMPVKAVEFVKSHGITGRMLNEYA